MARNNGVRVLDKSSAPKTVTGEEKVIGEQDFIVSKTDTKGFITYCNRIFVEMAGWSREELMGANHNLIRHPDMPRAAYQYVWNEIEAGREFFGFVKNLRKDGGYYWVFTYIAANTDGQGRKVGYTSFRRKPSKKGVETVIPLYAKMCSLEETEGMDASMRYLFSTLGSLGVGYNELMMTLQKGH